MNYFSKIFAKHLRKGDVPVEKLASDLGMLQGIFQYKEYDPITSKILSVSDQHNTIVNFSKSNVIRLISQGSSPWIGDINPASRKISKMRFGNSNGGLSAATKDLYYKINEPSMLKNKGAFPGGATSMNYMPVDNETDNLLTRTSQLNSPNDFTISEYDNTNHIYKITGWNTFTNVAGTVEDNMPPTSLIVALSVGGVVYDTLTFNNQPSYSTSGILPSSVKASNTNQLVYFGVSSRTSISTSSVDINAGDTGSKIVYDYSASKWIMYVQFDKALTTDITISMSFQIGMNNVINTIVPKTGYNNGNKTTNGVISGLTPETRFVNTSSYIDYYNVLSNCEYRDSDSDLIRDFSVTFSCNMGGQYGNGDTSQNNILSTGIDYTEAFLFSGAEGTAEQDNELFSAIKLGTSFKKLPTNAYYLSWTILAPIN